MKSETRTELMAIPIVAIVLVRRHRPGAASVAGVWALVPIGIAGLGSVLLIRRFILAPHPHPAAGLPAPERRSAAGEMTRFRVLVIADESLVDPGFPAQLAVMPGDARSRRS